MPFEKGNKAGGRTKGAKSKTTIVKETIHSTMWDKVADKITGEGIEKCWQEMSKLSGKDYVACFMQLSEYFKPKLTRASVEIEAKNSSIRVVMGKEPEN